jgi:hypothetical protein
MNLGTGHIFQATESNGIPKATNVGEAEARGSAGDAGAEAMREEGSNTCTNRHGHTALGWRYDGLKSKKSPFRSTFNRGIHSCDAVAKFEDPLEANGGPGGEDTPFMLWLVPSIPLCFSFVMLEMF